MAVSTELSVHACEQGYISYEKSESPHTKDHASGVSFIMGAIVIVLFNFCLLCFGYLIYEYVNAFEDKKRNEMANYMCSMVGVVIVVVMLRMGDMSKGNHNFYYI